MTQQAWAAVLKAPATTGGQESIVIESVCPTRLGAMVNALLTRCRVVVHREWPDGLIEDYWREIAEPKGYVLRQVVVSLA